MQNERVIGVMRAQRYSPNSVERDAAILLGVARQLESMEFHVSLIPEDEFMPGHAAGAVAVFSMARSAKALRYLEQIDLPILNSPEGVRHARRSVLVRRMADAGIPIPRSWVIRTDTLPDVVYPCWLKRSDECAQSSDDVIYVAGRDELYHALRLFQRRGIKEAVVSEHVVGDIIKFYGVEGTNFFEFYYPTVDKSFSKFGLERINGAPHQYPFDHAAFTSAAEQTARLLHLPVYGGDCIVAPDGSFRIIDFNDWPSFSCCRDRAAAAIASKLAGDIKHNQNKHDTDKDYVRIHFQVK